MTSPVRCADCSSLGTFTDQLLLLAERGFTAAPHTDIQRMVPGEFIIHVPSRPKTKGIVCVYYRE